MYDKYSQATQVTAGITKLGAHKGLLIVPTGGNTPTLSCWALDVNGATISLGLTFPAATTSGPQIFPMSIYAVTGITGANVYRLN